MSIFKKNKQPCSIVLCIICFLIIKLIKLGQTAIIGLYPPESHTYYVYCVFHAGVPSLPVIYHVITTTLGVSLIVQLQYAGHPSMITVLISAGNGGDTNVTFVENTAVSSNLNNYMFELSLPPGVYRFIVRTSNTFGSTGWSKEFPSFGLNGFKGLSDFYKD